jgi:hypothetical protein
MTGLMKRLQRIEAAIPQRLKPDSKLDDEIMRRAAVRISEEDRVLCESMEDLGSGRARTERERNAVKAYTAAIDLECKRAGYRSIDEFTASYCAKK